MTIPVGDGGGVAIIPHLSERLDALDWLTRRQLADGVSVALLTPGPVLLVATFAGYLHHGWAGAAASTLALLASPWALVQLAGGWLARVREHPLVQAAASGLLPAVVGLMGSAAVVLGGSFHGPVSLAIAGAAALTLVRYDLNPAWVVAAGVREDALDLGVIGLADDDDGVALLDELLRGTVRGAECRPRVGKCGPRRPEDARGRSGSTASHSRGRAAHFTARRRGNAERDRHRAHRWRSAGHEIAGER